MVLCGEELGQVEVIENALWTVRHVEDQDFGADETYSYRFLGNCLSVGLIDVQQMRSCKLFDS